MVFCIDCLHCSGRDLKEQNTYAPHPHPILSLSFVATSQSCACLNALSRTGNNCIFVISGCILVIKPTVVPIALGGKLNPASQTTSIVLKNSDGCRRKAWTVYAVCSLYVVRLYYTVLGKSESISYYTDRQFFFNLNLFI